MYWRWLTIAGAIDFRITCPVSEFTSKVSGEVVAIVMTLECVALFENVVGVVRVLIVLIRPSRCANAIYHLPTIPLIHPSFRPLPHTRACNSDSTNILFTSSDLLDGKITSNWKANTPHSPRTVQRNDIAGI